MRHVLASACILLVATRAVTAQQLTREPTIDWSMTPVTAGVTLPGQGPDGAGQLSRCRTLATDRHTPMDRACLYDQSLHATGQFVVHAMVCGITVLHAFILCTSRWRLNRPQG